MTKLNVINVSKSVKPVFSAVFSKMVNLTAYQYWKFPRKVFPNYGGKDLFLICFCLILLFKTVSKILLLIYYDI